MSTLLKRIVNTGILSLILAIAGVMLSMKYPDLFDRQSLTIMIVSMFLISSTVIIVVSVGESKPADIQTMYSFASIGVKFILSAVLALVYFMGFKKDGMNNILLFFVLYLTFTVYTVVIIVKVLNIRSLNNNKI